MFAVGKELLMVSCIRLVYYQIDLLGVLYRFKSNCSSMLLKIILKKNQIKTRRWWKALDAVSKFKEVYITNYTIYDKRSMILNL